MTNLIDHSGNFKPGLAELQAEIDRHAARLNLTAVRLESVPDGYEPSTFARWYQVAVLCNTYSIPVPAYGDASALIAGQREALARHQAKARQQPSWNIGATSAPNSSRSDGVQTPEPQTVPKPVRPSGERPSPSLKPRRKDGRGRKAATSLMIPLDPGQEWMLSERYGDKIAGTRATARAQGLPLYIPETVCRRGHADARYTSTGGCRACKAELQDSSRTAPTALAAARLAFDRLAHDGDKIALANHAHAGAHEAGKALQAKYRSKARRNATKRRNRAN